MIDRENVIKELHDARRYLEDKEWSDRGASPHIDAINDALALIDTQYKLIFELQNLISIGTKMMNGDKCDGRQGEIH